ncbi:MAG: hypothetical protein WD098_03230 [Balneolales bacterium]
MSGYAIFTIPTRQQVQENYGNQTWKIFIWFWCEKWENTQVATMSFIGNPNYLILKLIRHDIHEPGIWVLFPPKYEKRIEYGYTVASRARIGQI